MNQWALPTIAVLLLGYGAVSGRLQSTVVTQAMVFVALGLLVGNRILQLVANPIDRYSIGDRTPGLKTAEDGSVTIFMQADSPVPARSRIGCRPLRGGSGRSCACTSRRRRSWTEPTSSLQSGRLTKKTFPP